MRSHTRHRKCARSSLVAYVQMSQGPFLRAPMPVIVSMGGCVATWFHAITCCEAASTGDTFTTCKGDIPVNKGSTVIWPGNTKTCNSSMCCEVAANCDTFTTCSADRPVHKGSTVYCMITVKRAMQPHVVRQRPLLHQRRHPLLPQRRPYTPRWPLTQTLAVTATSTLLIELPARTPPVFWGKSFISSDSHSSRPKGCYQYETDIMYFKCASDW